LLQNAITNGKKYEKMLRNVLTLILWGCILLLRNAIDVLGVIAMKTPKKRKYHELKALKGKIRESDSSYRELARRVGMSPTTLSDKINGYSVFDTEEVNLIVHELRIEPQEIIKFFFPHMLRNVTNLVVN
jgi:hypothetical protein